MVLTVFHGVEHHRTEAMTATNGGRTPEKTSSGAVPVGNPASRRLRLRAGLSCRVTLLRTIKSPMTRRKMADLSGDALRSIQVPKERR
jgi:hypothetical protein